MPLFKQYGLHGTSVLVWKITETIDELQGMVSPDVAAWALEKYASEKRRAEWLAVRALLRQHLGDDVRVVYDAEGKPSLQGAGGTVSISHTDGYVAVALSADGDAGIDIELLSRDVMPVAGRFMSVGQFDDVPSDQRNFVALVNWCAKEALYKIVGNLGGNFKDNISVANFEPYSEGVVPMKLSGLASCCGELFIAHYSVHDDLLVVLCRKG